MTPGQSTKKISAMDSLERFSLAREKIQWMIDDLIVLISLHENNALINYSPLLSRQIPRSFAAKAFNVVQESIHRYEIIRLCTFWDGVDLEKANIPTVVELVDDRSVFRQVGKEMEDHFGSMDVEDVTPHPDPAIRSSVEALMKSSIEEFGRDQGVKGAQRLKKALKAGRKTIASEKLRSVRNARDKLAHRLKETRAEKNPGVVRSAKYGDEIDLLKETIDVVNGLHLSINGTSWDFKNSHRIARKNARALWEHCTFNIQD